MRTNEITMTEFLAWNGKGGAEGLEQYKKLLTRKHWLTDRWIARSEAMMEAKDSMSVFDETEFDDPHYVKYLKDYLKAYGKAIEYREKLGEVEKLLQEYTRSRR